MRLYTAGSIAICSTQDVGVPAIPGTNMLALRRTQQETGHVQQAFDKFLSITRQTDVLADFKIAKH